MNQFLTTTAMCFYLMSVFAGKDLLTFTLIGAVLFVAAGTFRISDSINKLKP